MDVMINGVRYVSAVEKQCADYTAKPYIFKAGDVVTCGGCIRVIVYDDDREDLEAYDLQGHCCCRGQYKFIGNGYRRIGKLRDYLPKDE